MSKLNKYLALFAVNLLLLLTGFSSVFTSLFKAWQKDEYSHGPLIPLLAILIGWNKLCEHKPVIKPTLTGVWITLGAYALYILSQISSFEPPSHYGLIVGIVGLCWSYFGKETVKILLPCFIYLIFAVPLPTLTYVTLSGDMQLMSSSLGVWFLELIGTSVYQEGNIIDLGGYRLQVVEACNGLRYLFPLMSFGFLMSLLLKDRMWKRVTLFLSTIPLTILMNALRIAIIGVTVDRWGQEMAEGLIHTLEGWVIFAVCVLVLFIETKILIKITPQKPDIGHLQLNYLSLPSGKVTSGTPNSFKIATASLILCALMTSGIYAGIFENKLAAPPPRMVFALFPTHLGQWRGTSSTLSSGELSILQLTDYWQANYTKEGSPAPVSLYAAYYASQHIGSGIHTPSNCLPGSGWKIEKRETIPFVIDNQTIPITRMLVKRGDEALVTYYWFQGRGRVLSGEYIAKWLLFVDSVTIHRTDGAIIRLTSPLLPGEGEKQVDDRIQDLLQEAFPEIQKYIPGR